VLGTKNKDVALMQVPEDLLLLREEVRELYISGLSGTVPAWLGELAHLEVLQLDGGFKNMDSEDDEQTNSSVSALPQTLGDLEALMVLTGTKFDALEALPASIGRLTSLKTLRIEACPALPELPVMSAMAALKSLSLVNCARLKELPCLENLTAMEQLSLNSLAELTQLPTSINKLMGQAHGSAQAETGWLHWDHAATINWEAITKEPVH